MEQRNHSKQWGWMFPGLLAAYILVHLIIRLAMGSSLELDEAEQVILGQELAWGYNTQPPLYSWLQWLFFELFGRSVTALALLKYLLISVIYLCCWRIACALMSDRRLAMLATFSLLLIPSLAWESLRDLTHSVLVTAIAAGCFLTVLRLEKSPVAGNYLFLGVLLGLGMLAKYSFAVFVLSLCIAALSHQRFRRLLLTPLLLLTIGAGVLITLPHGLWAYAHLEQIQGFVQEQVGSAIETGWLDNVLSGSLSLLMNIAEFLLLVWLVISVLMPGCYRPVKEQSAALALTGRFLLAGFLVCLCLILFMGATQFQSRWFQPLLILFPLYLVGRAAGSTSSRKLNGLAAILLFFTVAVMVLRLNQLWLAPYSGVKVNRMQVPAAQLAAQLQQQGFNGGTVIGENNLMAGTFGLQFSTSRILSPKTGIFEAAKTKEKGQCLMVWQIRGARQQMPQHFISYLSKQGINVDPGAPVSTLTMPYRYGSGEQFSLGYMIVSEC